MWGIDGETDKFNYQNVASDHCARGFLISGPRMDTDLAAELRALADRVRRCGYWRAGRRNLAELLLNSTGEGLSVFQSRLVGPFGRNAAIVNAGEQEGSAEK
jgi:hypothetical protein